MTREREIQTETNQIREREKLDKRERDELISERDKPEEKETKQIRVKVNQIRERDKPDKRK